MKYAGRPATAALVCVTHRLSCNFIARNTVNLDISLRIMINTFMKCSEW